ncbi:MAG: protein kinase [Polyangiaceae bacterium]
MTQGAAKPGGEAAEPAAPGLAPGTVIADRYKVERLLGEGGMGAVYRAEHVHMRKAVALKVLHPDASEFPEVVQRFEREAIAAAHISHPNVVSATDFGKLPDGSFFLVLEYVDGLSLRDAIAKGPLEPNRALHVIREIASALAVAHRSGVVHRDLKPENVMLVSRGTEPEAVKVFDFGIAKIDVSSVTGKQGSTLQPITRVGTVFGTPDYMAPEQAMGQPVDGRADIYSLGVLLFEMLAGGRPLKGGAVTLMRQHILQEVPDLPPAIAQGIDARIAEIVKRCLAKDADERYHRSRPGRSHRRDLDARFRRLHRPQPPRRGRSRNPPLRRGRSRPGDVLRRADPHRRRSAAHPSWKPAPAAYSAEASTKEADAPLRGAWARSGSGLIAVAVVSPTRATRDAPEPHRDRAESAVTTEPSRRTPRARSPSEAPSGEDGADRGRATFRGERSAGGERDPEPAASVERGADPAHATAGQAGQRGETAKVRSSSRAAPARRHLHPSP